MQTSNLANNSTNSVGADVDMETDKIMASIVGTLEGGK